VSDDLRSPNARPLPVIAVLAAVAAIADLAINRIGGLVLPELVSSEAALEWARAGAFPRNLAALACLGTLAALMSGYMLLPRVAPLAIRLLIAMLMGVTTSVFTIAAFWPAGRILLVLVFIAMLGVSMLSILFMSVALQHRPLRTTSALVLVSSVSSLTVLALVVTRRHFTGELGDPLGSLTRSVGELAWWLVPYAALWAGHRIEWTPRARVAGIAAVFVTALLVGLACAGQVLLTPHTAALVYGGAFRVDFLPERTVVLYGVLVSGALGWSAFELASKEEGRRQVGAAILLWISGGFAPRSPIQLLEALAAVMIFARAAQTLAEAPEHAHVTSV
jgi:hypothetical protein